MSTGTVPEPLRREVSASLRPVSPLPPVWTRALVAVAIGAVGLAAVVAAFKLSLRPDMARIPAWLGWGCTALQLAVGTLLVAMALREAVPGRSIPGRTVGLAVATGVLMQVVVGIATWMASPGVAYAPGHAMALGIGCATHDLALALPALFITLWLVFRALPVRPAVAGLLGGAGAALVADAVNHLVCPMSDLRHVLVWHTGVLLALMAVGCLVGLAWDRVAPRSG